MLRKPAAISASNLRRRIQDPALGWNRAAFVVLLCVIGGGHLFAEAPRTFTPPAAYNIQRYESGWEKNPFTLKTTPAVVTGPSFAADIAVAGISGDSANPTITLVNVKTHERFRLKTGGKAGNGMSVVRVRRGTTHKETVVEVSLGPEVNEVRYDDGYLRQVAGGGGGGAGGGGGPRGGTADSNSKCASSCNGWQRRQAVASTCGPFWLIAKCWISRDTRAHLVQWWAGHCSGICHC